MKSYFSASLFFSSKDPLRSEIIKNEIIQDLQIDRGDSLNDNFISPANEQQQQQTLQCPETSRDTSHTFSDPRLYQSTSRTESIARTEPISNIFTDLLYYFEKFSFILSF